VLLGIYYSLQLFDALGILLRSTVELLTGNFRLVYLVHTFIALLFLETDLLDHLFKVVILVEDLVDGALGG
jgi:hypothetical protein